LTGIAKAGAGFMIPKSDVTLFGVQRDNVFHIAGYMASVEAGGSDIPLLKMYFLEIYREKTGFCPIIQMFLRLGQVKQIIILDM